MEKVLLIGNNQRNGHFLSALQRTEFSVKEVVSEIGGWPGLNKVRDERPDLVVLEEEMALVGGVDILAALRHSTSALILVTGSGREEDAVDVLVRGADAYVPSTASSDVLLARIKALVRRQVLSPAVV